MTAAVGQLDQLADRIMTESKIPGMAVAVVYKGKVLYSKGFGLRKVGQPAKVDPDTVFQLASLSKSVGATVVAHEVTTGKVTWATPVIKNLPTFQLSQPYPTDNVTVGDMYAHRSGLPEHAGDLLEDLGYSQAQILERLRTLKLQEFGSTYAYTNFGLTAGAESVAAAAGQDWPTLSQQALYGPLGMTSTSSKFADYAARSDRAWTHVEVNGKWVAKYVRDADAQSPAGGVSSSANDMAKWLMMVLNNGTGTNGAKIASPDALTPAIRPQIVSSANDSDPTWRAGFYGFGFNTGIQASGRVQVSHSGAFSAGTGTNFVMDPLAKLGIVALTNGSPVGAAEAMNQEFMDLAVYGEPRYDWWTIYNGLLTGLLQPSGSLAGKKPPASPRPAAALTAYAGTYANDYVGPVAITQQGGKLTLVIGPKKMTYPLTHWDGDVFTYEPTGESANPGSVSKVTFTRDGKGVADKIDIEFYDHDGKGVLTR